VKTRSAKNKGKRLEKWVRDLLLLLKPDLTEDDVRVTVGQEGGADIKLSKKAREVINLSIECKNRESLKTIYSYYEQAQSNAKHNENPIVVLKMNRKVPVVLVDAEYFFNLL
jgi:hypothetical protein